ncbi:MAG: ATP cone domain-containing protein, partial [Cetobacterium sp.]
MKLKVTKKDNTTEDFDFNKILIAVRKSAERIGKPLSETAEHRLKFEVMPLIHRDVITVGRLHEVVEIALSKVDSEVADSYRGFRNYIKDLSVMMETVVDGVNKSMDQRDRSNSNMNSLLFSSRRTNASNILLTEMFEKFFLDEKERQATRDGFFYIHDKSNRLIGTHNCCVVKLE